MAFFLLSLMASTMLLGEPAFTMTRLSDSALQIRWPQRGPDTNYLVRVEKNGLVAQEFWTASASHTLELEVNTGDLVTFRVAASGEPFSLPLLVTAPAPLPISPRGEAVAGEVWFSWDRPAPFDGEISIEGPDGPFRIPVARDETTVAANLADLGEYRWKLSVSPLLGGPVETPWRPFDLVSSLSPDRIVFGAAGLDVSSASETRLSYPEFALRHPDGSIWVSDTMAHVVRRCQDDICRVVAGRFMAEPARSGHAHSSALSTPGGLLVEGDGAVLVFEIGTSRILRLKSGHLEVVQEIPGAGKTITRIDDDLWAPIRMADEGAIFSLSTDRSLQTYAGFSSPSAVAEFKGLVFLLDSATHQILIFEKGLPVRLVDAPAGSQVLAEVDGTLYLGGHTALYRLDEHGCIDLVSDKYANITAVSRYDDRHLLVTDSDAGSVYRVDKITGSRGVIIGAAGQSGTVVDLEVSGTNLFMLDNQLATVWRLDLKRNIIERFAGTGAQDFREPGGHRLDYAMFYPTALTIDGAGNLFVAEQHRVLRIESTTGEVTLFAGGPTRDDHGYRDQCDRLDARFNSIRGLSFDRSNHVLYIADTYNNRIRAIDQTGFVRTVAGAGFTEEPEFGVEATRSPLSRPHSILISEGRTWISDSWNNSVHELSKSGLLRPFAGQPEYSGYQGNGSYHGDGGHAVNARLNTPIGLAYDPKGESLYIADSFNHRVRVVQCGKIWTVAGGKHAGFSLHAPGLLNMPLDVAVVGGDLFIADSGNSVVRRSTLRVDRESCGD